MAQRKVKTVVETKDESKGESTRRHIIQVAIRLFSKDGYSNVAIRSIAQEVGITQAGVLRHFPEKRSILKGALEFVLRANHQRVEANQSPELDAYQSLIAHAHGNIQWALECPEQAQFILLLYYCAVYDQEFAKLYQQITEIGRARISRWLHAGRRENSIKLESAEIDFIASNLHSLLVGIIIDLLASGDSGGKKSVDRAVKRFTATLDSLTHSKLAQGRGPSASKR